MSTPLSVYKAAERYVKATAAMHPEKAADIATKQANVVCQEVNKMTFDLSAASDIQEALVPTEDSVDSPFSIDNRQIISATILSMCDGECPVATASHMDRAQDQSCTSWFNYAPSILWNIMGSDDNIKNKFRHVVQFNVDVLQLRNPDAQTKRIIVSAVHTASGMTDRIPDDCYQDVKDFTRINVQLRDQTPGGQSLKEFPSNPTEFVKKVPRCVSR